MPVLNLEQIKAAAGNAVLTIDVPVREWGGNVRLRKLSAAAGITFGRRHEELPKGDDGQIASPEDAVRFYALILSASIIDEQGSYPFDDEAGIAWLEGQTFDVINSLGVQALRLNGMTEALDEAKEKNSNTLSPSSPSN